MNGLQRKQWLEDKEKYGILAYVWWEHLRNARGHVVWQPCDTIEDFLVLDKKIIVCRRISYPRLLIHSVSESGYWSATLQKWVPDTTDAMVCPDNRQPYPMLSMPPSRDNDACFIKEDMMLVIKLPDTVRMAILRSITLNIDVWTVHATEGIFLQNPTYEEVQVFKHALTDTPNIILSELVVHPDCILSTMTVTGIEGVATRPCFIVLAARQKLTYEYCLSILDDCIRVHIEPIPIIGVVTLLPWKT